MNKYKQGYKQGKFDTEMSILNLPYKIYFGQTFTQNENVTYQFLIAETYEEATEKFKDIFKEDRLDLLSVICVDSILEDWNIICMQKEKNSESKI